MIDLIGAPFDLGGQRLGSRMGPAAARLAGLAETLRSLGCAVKDRGDLTQPQAEPGAMGRKVYPSAYVALKEVRSSVEDSLALDSVPLVIGGDHTVSIGSVGAALSKYGTDLAVLWVDAHSDLNTPGTSDSGNIHGMPVAALMGLESGVDGEQEILWRRIMAEVVGAEKLGAERAAWLGLREVDGPEQEQLAQMPGCFTSTMYDLDRNGLVSEIDRLDAWTRESGASQLWISFDVDVLDPILAPGTGTAVRGGLTYREMHLMGEMLSETMRAPGCPYRLAGLDLVEINPLFDRGNETAKTAVEWIASIFGKTILGKR
ncbi:MAG: arginase [Armatimonadetes bacterium]|nr:arginase [Armatimonadota bacterium]